jgi:hypothetical protein
VIQKGFQLFKSIFFGILAQAFKQGDVSRGSQNSTDTGDVSEGVAVHQPLSTTFPFRWLRIMS